MTNPTDWWIEGTYFESCNCEAVCPCRTVGGRDGGRSTYGVCDFALSWRIERGEAGDCVFDGLEVVMVGSYDDDEPGSPWSVVLYVDDDADADQHDALADIFLGRAGSHLELFSEAIGEVHAVRSARIRLDHAPDDPTIDVDDAVTVRTIERVDIEETVSCRIPGHDRPGTEYRGEVLRVDEPPLDWAVEGRCAFATDFAYQSEPA